MRAIFWWTILGCIVALQPASGATYRDVKFGQAAALPAPVNGSGGTGNGFATQPQDRQPALTRDGRTLVWQSYLVKQPDAVYSTDNNWYVVQSTRSAWNQPWSTPVEIIASTAGDDARGDQMPSISRDGLWLLYNEDTAASSASSWREPFRIASRSDLSSPFDNARVVDIIDARFQGVLDEYGAEVYYDQYRCGKVGSPQQRWHVYPQDGFFGPCGNTLYFMAEDIWPSLTWQFLSAPPPPWSPPGNFNVSGSEGYTFRCEPLTFSPGDLDGQDGWTVLSGQASIVSNSGNALEFNQFIEFPAGTASDAMFDTPAPLPFPPNEQTGAFNINTDAEPSLSADRLTLFWQQFDYRGGSNFYDQDIVTTSRISTNDPWGGPAHVEVTNVNDTTTGVDELSPTISQDGLEIFFVRSGRLYVATRVNTASPFGTPQPLIFDGTYDEVSYTEDMPEISADGQHLYFVSNKTTTTGMSGKNIFVATRGVSALYWEDVEDLGNGIHWWPDLPNQFGGDELSPTVTDDELAILFSANRLENGWEGIYIATRNSTSEPFGNRREVTELNAAGMSTRGAELGFGYTRDDVLNGLAEVYLHRGDTIDQATPDLYRAAPAITEPIPDNVVVLDTGNVTTSENALFTSRFAVQGVLPSSSAVIELGYDDSVSQHVFARLELNVTIGGEFAAFDGNGSGGGTATQIDLVDLNTGGGTCTTFPVAYEAGRWYLVEITSQASASSPSYDVVIRDPFRAGPLIVGTCNFPDSTFVPIGSVSGMGVVDASAGPGPLNFVRITGDGVRIDAGPTCTDFITMSGWPTAGLLQTEAIDQPVDVETWPQYGEVRSLRLKTLSETAPEQAGPVRTNNRMSSPYVTDDNLVVYYSSTGYWSNGAYAPPAGYGEEDGYYGYAEPVLWRGHRNALRDQATTINQTVQIGDAEPVFCPGVFNLASSSRRLLDPELGPDGLYFVTSDVIGGYDGEMKIWFAPFFGDLDHDGDVDANDQAAFDTRMAGAYDVEIDYDLDGINDADDQAAFDHNLGFQAGDGDGDNDVDEADYQLMLDACEATICADNWNATMDLNRDLIIDTADLDLLRLSYGLGVPGGAGSLPPLPDTLVCPLTCDHVPVFDVNDDGYVDLTDFETAIVGFQACHTGPAADASSFGMLPEECRCMDIDGNGAIDQADFARFQRCYSPLQLADPTCDD